MNIFWRNAGALVEVMPLEKKTGKWLMSRQTYRDDVELGMIPLQGRKSLDRA